MNDRIIFLDYDGVVNNKLWGLYKKELFSDEMIFDALWAHPEDNKVNNFQALCWLNLLYKRYPYDIVVTSSWRLYKNYKECLYNGGLDDKIKIIDKLPIYKSILREDEIHKWIVNNNFNGDFIILDDEEIFFNPSDPYKFQKNHNLILVDPTIGFCERKYNEVINSFSKQEFKRKNIDEKM